MEVEYIWASKIEEEQEILFHLNMQMNCITILWNVVVSVCLSLPVSVCLSAVQ